MAAAANTTIHKVRGTLIGGVTAWSASSHGGTVLGSTRAHVLRVVTHRSVIRAREWGGRVAERIRLDDQLIFLCMLRGWDHDAVGKFFPFVQTTSSRNRWYHNVGDDAAGRGGEGIGQERAERYLWLPNNATAHAAIGFYAAIPDFDENLEYLIGRGNESGFPVMLTGAVDASGRSHVMGRISDFTAI